MDYQKIYNSIILFAKNQNRKKSKGTLYERHHVVPKSVGGDNSIDNLVLLTPKEHYLCHRLLVEIYKNTIHENKMYYAMWCMVNGLGNQKRHATSSRIYQHLRLKIHTIQSKNRYDNRKPIEQYDLNGILLNTFDSPTAASLNTNINKGSIENCARGETKSAGGFNWRYINSSKQIDIITFNKPGVKKGNIPYSKGKKFPPGTRNIKYKKVTQYSKDMDIIKTWDSIHDASFNLGISRSSIENCAGGKSKTAGSFIWKYE